MKLGKRSGLLEIIGKRNTYREVPLNATARSMLEEYLPTLPPDALFLFPSGKTKETLSECALGYIVKKYAQGAKLSDVSPHDLWHRFSYRMAESVPLHRLAQIIGHDSWIRLSFTSGGRGTICNKGSKRSRGDKGGTGYV